MMGPFRSIRGLATIAALALAAALTTAIAPPVEAAPEGQISFAVHVTLAPKWLDPGETESAITPFMMLYAIHDALVKPMPGGLNTPSLAESWTASKDGLTYEFLLRNGIKFHNGDPVTAEDVKFSFERYRGGGAKLFKERVKEHRKRTVQATAALDDAVDDAMGLGRHLVLAGDGGESCHDPAPLWECSMEMEGVCRS